MVTKKQQKQLELTERIEKVNTLIDKINLEIEQIKTNSNLAPDDSWLVRFRAKGKGGAYWYYKWQSDQAIFLTKNGNYSRYKYVGKAGSQAFFEAVEMMKNRTKISALQQVLHTLELARLDLVEEATRFNERQ